MNHAHTVATPTPSIRTLQFRFLSFFLFLTIICTSFFPYAQAAGPDEWRSRSIYQVITDRFARTDGSTTYPCDPFDNALCGGTWRGLIDKLDYIHGMGFTAIWISPIPKNIANGTNGAGQPYHGFWTQDAEAINDNMGSEQDLLDLSQALHDRGMYLMVDLVLNNMAYAGPGEEYPYEDYNPFNKKEYYHDFCYVTNFADDYDSQNCWLGSTQLSLSDLDQDNEYVAQYWIDWSNNIAAKYSIDGFRIDAAKHVQRSYWHRYQPGINNTYTVGEALNGDYRYACSYAGTKELAGVLNYPLWYGMVGTLTNTSKPMSGLRAVFEEGVEKCLDTTLLGIFTENHDQPRFASYTNDMEILRNALVFNMLTDGVPIVYYGAEQGFVGNGDPTNRESLWQSNYDTNHPLYQLLKKVNVARNAVANLTSVNGYWSGYWTWKAKVVLQKDTFLAFRKGYDKSIVSIVTNQGTGSPDQGPYVIGDTNFLSGDTIVDVLTCKTQTVQAYGIMTVTVKNGEPQVWIPTEYLVNSTDICPSVSRHKTAFSTVTISSSASAISIISSGAFILLTIIASFL